MSHLALDRIDAALVDWSSLSLVEQSDVVDLLLDLRNLLLADGTPSSPVPILEGSTS